MNRIPRIRRVTAVLTGLALAVLGLASRRAGCLRRGGPGQADQAGAPRPPQSPAVTRIVVVGGMPGWQIALVAAGTALIAAALAVLADRARTAHRRYRPAGRVRIPAAVGRKPG